MKFSKVKDMTIFDITRHFHEKEKEKVYYRDEKELKLKI